MADAQHRLALILEAKNQASATLRQVKGDVAGVQTQLGGLYQAAQQAIPGLDMLLGGAGIAGGIMAGRWLWDQANQLAELGAQADRTADAFERRIGGDAVEALGRLRSASQGTISDVDLMQASARASMLGVADDADTLAKLLEVAATRGRDMGISTSQAFDNMVTGIGRLSPMILDNLGIVMDAEGTYAAYAAAIGKTADALSDVEKRQALVQRVTSEATGDLGGLDAAGRLESQEAAWENFTTALGQNLTELTRIQGDTAQVLQFMAERMNEGTDATRAADKATQGYRERLSELAAQGNLSAASLGLIAQKAEAYVDAYKAGDATLEETRINIEALFASVDGLIERTDAGTLSEFEFRDALAATLDGLHAYSDAVERMPGLMDAYLQAMEREKDTLAALERQYRETWAAAWDYHLSANALSDIIIDPLTGVPKRKVAPPVVSATERLEWAREDATDRLTSMVTDWQAEMRSIAESVLTATTVTPEDMFRAQTGALGGYVDKWDESARRLQDIANRGAASPWWQALEIPEEVLAQGEEAVRIWAGETADAVRRGVRPDMIDWEAFDRAAEEYMRDQEARERTLAIAMGRLGGVAPESDVREMLGMPADYEQEAVEVALAFDRGLGSANLGQNVTDKFLKDISRELDRWEGAGNMTITAFARGMENGVSGDRGLRIMKQLWPFLVPMLDRYYSRGVTN